MTYKVESNVAYPRREAHAQPPARDCWAGQIDSHKAIIGASQKLQRLSARNLAVREPAGRPAATGTSLEGSGVRILLTGYKFRNSCVTAKVPLDV